VIVAVVSDVHANIEALDAVLADAGRQSAERLWCLGDIVGYGADPNPVCDRLRVDCDAAVAGNHDWAACGKMTLGYFNSAAAAAAEWTASQLSPSSREWLASLPLARLEDGVRLVHGSPSDPEAWQYVLSVSEAEGEMASFEETLCLIGHSHFPGAFESDGSRVRYSRTDRVRLLPEHRYLVNVGSVGQPRDGDPRACYLLLDTEKSEIVHRRVPYDIAAAQRKILSAGLPPFLASRLAQGA
jgi:diadenosine tetraphosphatase ApaH/serine/threonine PP2A family protein phosphatase